MEPEVAPASAYRPVAPETTTSITAGHGREGDFPPSAGSSRVLELSSAKFSVYLCQPIAVCSS
jgi:hypothetical protein